MTRRRAGAASDTGPGREGEKGREQATMRDGHDAATAIDSHFHWYPRSHLEALAGRDGFPRVEREGKGYRYLFNGGRSVITLTPDWFDLDAGLAVAERSGAAKVVCTTGVLSGLIDQLPAPEAAELAASYNEALARAQRERPGQVFGTAMAPCGEPGRAVAAVDHAVKDLGLHGVNLPPVGGDMAIDDKDMDPFYARVAELGVPLLVHPTDLVFDEVLGGDRALQLTLGRLVDSSVTVLRLIFSGVLERHPSLTVVHTHAGGVLPFQAGRIDKNGQITGLPHPPSVYLRRTYVDTVAPQELTIQTAVAFYGAGHVLYGTDYPCWRPESARRVLDNVPLGATARSQIMAGNAAEVFGLASPPSAP